MLYPLEGVRQTPEEPVKQSPAEAVEQPPAEPVGEPPEEPVKQPPTKAVGLTPAEAGENQPQAGPTIVYFDLETTGLGMLQMFGVSQYV